MTRKRKCNSESNSFVAAAEQVCVRPVLEHRQRLGRRNIAWQAIPHLCFSKIEIGFSFMVQAHPGSPVQRAVKRGCVS